LYWKKKANLLALLWRRLAVDEMKCKEKKSNIRITGQPARLDD
jgi:hypothetical protein